MDAHDYDARRFPAVLRLWTDYGDIARDLDHLTSHMNSRDSGRHESALDELVQHSTVAVWADSEYQIDIHMHEMKATLTALYDSAGLRDPEDRAENYLMGIAVNGHAFGDRRFSRSSIPGSVARRIDSQDPQSTAMKLLGDLGRFFREDAAALVAPTRPQKRP